MNTLLLFFKEIFTAKGPAFLLGYAVLFACLYVILWFILRRTDSSRSMPPLEPPEEKPNPFGFAGLRAGHHEIVRLFLFELISSGLIEQTKGADGKVSKESKLRRTDKPVEAVPDLSPEGRTFLDWFQRETEPKNVFFLSPLESPAKQWVGKFKKRFDEDRLVRPYGDRMTAWFI